MSKVKIAVAGPIPRDTIITHKGETIEKYGCVTHPAIALAKLLDDRGEVFPVTHINKVDEAPVKKLFSQYGNIRTEGIHTHHDKGTVIELRFLDQNNRMEKQRSSMSPILPEDVEPFLDADVFVFVPITDFEIALDTLKYLKENSKAQIIFDAHGPTTWVDEEGTRLRKIWKDKKDWLPYIDVLKMNLEESQFSWFEDENILTEYNEELTDHLDSFADACLELGTRYVYVTLDSRGCVVYWKDNGKTEKTFIPSMKVDHVVDTTGCGDSFAGGLAYGHAVHADPVIAAQYANILGALRTQGKDFSVFKDRKETEALRKSVYL
ncbi:carbohydrate kinase family protein [Robertkochia aurantiaca]|uniref:carbohydrate kinase family protein n=1 Tax=Robertkochia aurantiaca TaxID=2873700 RepID=UPI001CCAA786|nr:carbohydrate kinase family protein [Robertkochia sp. 3YJGBD-33]